MRIVRDVQNRGRLPGQYLKTTTHDRVGYAHAHRLLRHRQLLAQRIQRSQCRRRIGQLIITAHRRHGQAVARAVFADKAPLFALIVLNHLIAEIAVNQFQIRADGIHDRSGIAAGFGSAHTAGRCARKIPAFSKPMASRVSPKKPT